jgi:molecular chaperone HtpG
MYTLHDTGHSFRIMEYMSKIITNLDDLNELEIVMLVYAALLYDVGMAVSAEYVELIKNDCFEATDIKFSVLRKVNNYDDTIGLQEYVRRIHAQLSGRYITANKNYFTLPSPNSPTEFFERTSFDM